MLNRKSILLVLLIFYSVNLMSQNKEIDSLQIIYKLAENDSVQISIMHELGSLYFDLSENDSSIYYYEKALNLAVTKSFREATYRSNYMLGLIYTFKSFYTLSEDYFLEALKVAEEYNNIHHQIHTLNGLGRIYDEQLQYDKALEMFNKAYKLCDSENDKNEITVLLHNIGLIYQVLNDFDKAKEYLNKSFEISKEMDSKRNIAAYYLNYGLILREEGKYDEAIDYYEKSIVLFEELEHNYAIGICYVGFGELYLKLEKFEEAESYYKKALIINEKVEDLKSNASILLGIGDIEIQKENYLSALDNYQRSLQISIDIGAIDQAAKAYEKISEYYNIRKNYKQAYSFQVKYKIANDSAYNINNNLKLKEFELRNKKEKEKNEIKLLKQEQLNSEITIKKAQTVRLFLVIFLFLLLLFIVFLIIAGRRLKKTNKNLKLKNVQIQKEKKKTKLAEEALKAEEEHLKSFIKNSNDFVLYRIKRTFDDKGLGELIFYSSSASEVLGVESPENINNWYSNIHEEDVDRVRRANLISGKKGTKFNETFRTLHLQKNKWIWVNAVSTPIINSDGSFEYFNGVAIDITDRIELEKALKESEQKYKYLVNNISEGISVNDENEVFTLANKKTEVIFGVKSGDLVGRSFKEFLSKENSIIIDNKNKERQKGKKDNYTIEIIREDNEKRFLNIKSIPDFSEQKDFRSVAIIRDITEEKIAKEKLIASEENYRFLFDKNPNSLWEEDYSIIKEMLDDKKAEGITNFNEYINNNPDFVQLCNANYIVKNINEETLKLLKVKSKEEIFKHPNKFFTETSYDFFKEVLIAFANDDKSLKGEIVLKDSTGKKINVLIRLFVFNEYKTVIVSMIDITEKKEAEQKLLFSEKEFRNLFDNNPVALWEEDYRDINKILDKKKGEGVQNIKEYIKENRYFSQLIKDHHNIKRVNKETLKFFKVPNEEYLSKNIDRFFTEKSDIVFFELIEAFANNKKEFQKESTYLDNNGTLLHIILKVNVIKEDYSRVIVSFTDISYRLKIEEKLIIAQEKAEESNNLKSQFLANMSHEIRTPMNAIIGFSDILKKQITDLKHKLFIDRIIISGNNLLSLINDILDLSKIEANELRIVKVPTDIKEILDETALIFSEKIKEKNLEFKILAEKELPNQLILDEVRIRQILINLLGNALKFTDEGTITVSLRTEINRNSKLNLFINVKDTGIGIPKEQINSIFEVFRQVDGQSTRKFGGTGLGLSITKNLVEMMGGSIFVTSDNNGSEFIVCLNDVELFELNENIENKDEQIILYKENMKILYADDLEMNREVFKMLIENENIELIEANDGDVVLELLKVVMPDLILLDIQMPKLDGYKTTELIRKDKKFDKIPIIALTANAEGEDSNKINTVFDSYITKPITLKKLEEGIFKFLKRH